MSKHHVVSQQSHVLADPPRELSSGAGRDGADDPVRIVAVCWRSRQIIKADVADCGEGICTAHFRLLAKGTHAMTAPQIEALRHQVQGGVDNLE